ncbi:solute carrier family 49 member 4-like [Littorina saxatilis]|uniref:solute carrier family 49 member 4-like n=1 Tax=Littorina saxatilis TaxID=31220 RepID=UPI0038B5A294
MDADAKQPLLNSPITDADHVSSACSTPGYNTISASGPQLCHSPPTYHTLSSSSNIQSPDDTEPEGRAEGETRVYRRRWYVLMVYSLLSATQGGVWNSWGPIAVTAEDAFGWTDATIDLLSNWGPIAFLVSGIVFSWMMDVKGLRMSCVITGFLVAAGTGLRCITFNTPAVTWLTHVGQFLNGLGGPVAMAAPPILSAVWFPPEERTTATAIGTVLNYLGVAASFVMGWTMNFLSMTEGGWSAAIFLMLLLYFPSKPPLPPCPSAAIPRENFVQGLKHLLTTNTNVKGFVHFLFLRCRCGQIWLVAIVYGISTGTLSCWSSVLDVILKPHGIGESWFGNVISLLKCAAHRTSITRAWFMRFFSSVADFFKRIMKWLFIIFYIKGTASFVVFALATIKVIPSSTVLFYTTIIVGNTALNAAVPLIFELACELSYPTGEGTTIGVLTIMNNISGLIFLLVFMIPGIGEIIHCPYLIHEWHVVPIMNN